MDTAGRMQHGSGSVFWEDILHQSLTYETLWRVWDWRFFPIRWVDPGVTKKFRVPGQVRERQHEGYSDYRLRVETKEGIIDEEPP
jgi:hypothetical protein